MALALGSWAGKAGIVAKKKENRSKAMRGKREN